MTRAWIGTGANRRPYEPEPLPPGTCAQCFGRGWFIYMNSAVKCEKCSAAHGVGGIVSFRTAQALAERFHEAYERLAPSFGYTTRPETRAFDPQSANGRLMVAVCQELLAAGVGVPFHETFCESPDGTRRVKDE